MIENTPAHSEQFQRAVARIDEYNRRDPRGWEHPYALAVVDWIERLRPGASEALHLAGRAHHIGRWQIPRDRYPRNRGGYLRWRSDLQLFHADEAAAILTDCGYPPDFVERVRDLVRKRNLRDEETRTLEDAACLVFMERRLAGFRQQHEDVKLQRIIRRTWAKMSPAGREAALRLSLPEPVQALLRRSLDAGGWG